MESTDSSPNASNLQLPPGFRFHPTDEELLVHYLKRKLSSSPIPAAIIADIDLYKFDPWELPNKAVFGEQEWYFFTPRERKYPNGGRPNRATISGYWKATGTDKSILSSNGSHRVGVKKALVFYGGKPPKGVKTNWIMHEYRLLQPNSNPFHPAPTLPKPSLRLDDWVLCRIYMKNSTPTSTLKYEVDDFSRVAPPPPQPKLVISGGRRENCFFDGSFSGEPDNTILHHKYSSNISQLPSSSCSPKATQRSVSSHLWYDAVTSINSYNGAEQNAVSFVSLLNQNAPFQPPPLFGSFNDAVLRHEFQLPSLNWNS